MKRSHDGTDRDDRPTKLLRALSNDRISRLSDELILRILSFVPVTTLNICQRVSHKFYSIAGDSQLWKAAYYNRFVRPRASRIPKTRDASASFDHLLYSSTLSKWLDEENLVKRGQETNWKKQYKLRHNWSRGKCVTSEIAVAERPPIPPLLVRMHEGLIFTADSHAGLRAWTTRNDRRMIASISLVAPGSNKPLVPTSLCVDSRSSPERQYHEVAVGFEDGSFTVYKLQKTTNHFHAVHSHPASSNGQISALAYASPYLLSMTERQLVSLYKFPGKEDPSSDVLAPPRLLCSLKSHSVSSPLSLAIRTTSASVIASVAYAVPTYLSGWSVGIQEMHLSRSGQLLESRLATASDEHFHSLAGSSTLSPPANCSISSMQDRSSVPLGGPINGKPTSLSYSHPYLLASHPDNTLTLYLVTSTALSLSIGSGSRLWGHTSSVSGAHVGGRGKAVSVSRQGDELRVWELEGSIASSAARRRLLAGELSVRIQPERQSLSEDLSVLSEAISRRGSGLGLALEHKFDDLSVARGWVGFDEENVIVLREKSQGRQALVVYDFS